MSQLKQDTYEVFAVLYGQRTGTRGSMLIHADPHDLPMPMDYYVWAVRNAQRTVVVDIGFGREDGEGRGRDWLRCPTEGLAAIGIDAAAVEDVVITHMHYDHVGNLHKFPRARFHLQDSEMEYATGRAMTHTALRHSFTVDNVTDMVRMVYGDRVVFHDGDGAVAPGISVHHIGGHTRGLQVVRVNTARGAVVLASDASHYYENMQAGIPFATVENITLMLEGHRRLEMLADSHEHIVPGHDPLVMQRYPAVSEATRGIAVRLDVPPAEGEA
jgi:glyoxylase-like metal-dependent hydrolase (beta-lactamase superfamily II)